LIERDIKVVNSLGIHARPAALLVKTLSGFESNVSFEKDSLKVNGRSVLGVMMLAAPQGSFIKVEIDGPDENDCMLAIEDVFVRGFDEE